MRQCIQWYLVVLSVLSGHLALAQTGLTVQDLRCEYKVNPLGLGEMQPRLSWTLNSNQRNVVQTAYRIQVADNEEDLTQGQSLWWDSGRVETDRSIQVAYQGRALRSSQRQYWRVRVWDNQGNVSDWSKPTFWETGLLAQNDWQARWIEPALDEAEDMSNPCPLLRKTWQLNKPVKAARLHVTAHGLYEMYINQKRVGDQVFTPGWTAYDKRLQVQTYDVTTWLKPGDNAMGVLLGDGWYRGRLVWQNARNLYGSKLALLAQLVVTYEDGTQIVVVTDKSWKAATGPILMSDIYDGEVYDARLEKPGWTGPEYDDEDWSSVTIADHDLSRLVASVGPPVKRMEMLKPVKIFTTPKDETVVDMGQNMVGRVRLTVQGPVGTEVKLTHFEVLDKDGNVYLDNLRSAQQQVTYILKGIADETYETHFTFQGFRYVKVEGWPGPLTPDNMIGVAIYSDIQPTGTFNCSNTLINQLQHNIEWGQKGNFLDVPTDCPQRDERMGWTGDAQVFARTACFIADCAAFYTKWLGDVAADQTDQGAVPHVVPDVLSRDGTPDVASAGWADVATVIPWTVYLSYGDTRILERQYASMKGWVDYMASRAGESCFWKQDFTYGDWLSFNTTRSDYPGAYTDKDLITQAYFGRSTALLIKAAKVLDKDNDVRHYSDLLNKIKKVFQDEFVTPNGRMTSGTQTAYCLALAFDLLPGDIRAEAAARLAEDVRRFGHITTGFLGTPLICHVLGDYGYFDEAFMLLNRKEYPSWLYPVTQGATTIWERWDGQKPDGTFQTPGMNSFNHYAYGAIGEWLYRVVVGIEIDENQPGYKHIIIQPHPGGGLTYARASLRSMYGKIQSHWQIGDNRMVLEIEIPANTQATVYLPKATLDEVQGLPGDARQQENQVIVQVGSGQYRFAYAWRE